MIPSKDDSYACEFEIKTTFRWALKLTTLHRLKCRASGHESCVFEGRW